MLKSKLMLCVKDTESHLIILQATTNTSGDSATENIVHGTLSSNLGGSCKPAFHARVPVLHLSPCEFSIFIWERGLQKSFLQVSSHQ